MTEPDIKEEGIESPEEETKAIQKVTLMGFFLNLILLVIKGILSVLSGSLAITASTVDSATDAFASLVLYGGLKLSVRKTQTFPLGLYKIENIASVILSLFIFFAGYEIARRIFISGGQAPDISLPVIMWLLAVTIGIFLFGQYALNVGRRTGSPTLKAEARHRQTDSLSSMVVLVTSALTYWEIQLDLFGITIDQIGAVLVLIFVAHTGWQLLSDGMRVLLDASIDFDTLAEIRKILKKHPFVSEIKSLVGRSAGRYRFIQATLVFRTDDLKRAHTISHQIESDIRRDIPHVARVIIHYEPPAGTYSRIAVSLDDDTGTISEHFGDAPYFAIVTVRLKDNGVEKKEIFTNPHAQAEKAKGILVAEWLVEKKIDHVLLKSEAEHKGPRYVFSNAGVEIHHSSADSLGGAIQSIPAITKERTSKGSD